MNNTSTDSNILDEISFLELLKEPLILNELQASIKKIVNSLITNYEENIDTVSGKELSLLMNTVFHYLGLQITKWDNNDIIYFTVPKSYTKDFIIQDGMTLAKEFKKFMLWVNTHTTQNKNFTFKVKVRDDKWDSLMLKVTIAILPKRT